MTYRPLEPFDIKKDFMIGFPLMMLLAWLSLFMCGCVKTITLDQHKERMGVIFTQLKDAEDSPCALMKLRIQGLERVVSRYLKDF